jgi:hypothetical protein
LLREGDLYSFKKRQLAGKQVGAEKKMTND